MGDRRVDPCERGIEAVFDWIGYAALARRLAFAGSFFAAGGVGALGLSGLGPVNFGGLGDFGSRLRNQFLLEIGRGRRAHREHRGFLEAVGHQ